MGRFRRDGRLAERHSRTLNELEKGESGMTDKPSNGYEVLSPWAEADPIPFRGISPRLGTLEGKKIGLLANSKRAAAPTMQVRFHDIGA